MENIIVKGETLVEDMIYVIRGVQVMLQQDVAKLYQVETKVLNQTIKRNINRFPGKFCFQLTNEEIDILPSRSQFVTLNKSNNLRGYNPTSNTPSWVYNSNYQYWTMSQYEDSSQGCYVDYSGNLRGHYPASSDMVRPVLEVLKSADITKLNS